MIPMLFCASAAMAQPQWELGGVIGYGWYRNGTIFGSGATAQAGIRNRFVAGAVLGEQPYEYLSGEIRYVYQDGHPFLSSGGQKYDVQGQSHTITYDFLVHLRPRASRWQPFVAAGVGGKDYVIAGPVPANPAFSNLGRITTQDQWKFVFDVGGGVKYRLFEHVLLRVDFRDYMTTFPKQQIAPAAGNTARGIFQQFTPMFGVSGWF
jgi:opacity protein-like surface antigen